MGKAKKLTKRSLDAKIKAVDESFQIANMKQIKRKVELSLQYVKNTLKLSEGVYYTLKSGTINPGLIGCRFLLKSISPSATKDNHVVIYAEGFVERKFPHDTHKVDRLIFHLFSTSPEDTTTKDKYTLRELRYRIPAVIKLSKSRNQTP